MKDVAFFLARAQRAKASVGAFEVGRAVEEVLGLSGIDNAEPNVNAEIALVVERVIALANACAVVFRRLGWHGQDNS
ncbi:hypothetical protein VHAB30_16600 [Variovorax boronicumulans]|nr:hypothetical protein VHAB30_16600 [Variovorax boronicumulans]